MQGCREARHFLTWSRFAILLFGQEKTTGIFKRCRCAPRQSNRQAPPAACLPRLRFTAPRLSGMVSSAEPSRPCLGAGNPRAQLGARQASLREPHLRCTLHSALVWYNCTPVSVLWASSLFSSPPPERRSPTFLEVFASDRENFAFSVICEGISQGYFQPG